MSVTFLTNEDKELIDQSINQLSEEIDAHGVTPQMFGAVGDGVSDDTVAFQQCIASGSDVYVPQGTYLISGTLSVNKGVRITGCKGAVINLAASPLFEVTTYYAIPFELRRVQINANSNRVLVIGSRDWGASAVVDDVRITGAVDSCIEIKGGFNVILRRVIVEGGGAETGSILKIGTDAAADFSNMVYLESCIITANRNTNLLECGEAYCVKAVNCTFEGFNCAVVGQATLIGCWFEKGKQCVEEDIPNTVVSSHFADVEQIKPTGITNTTFFPKTKSTATVIYDVPGYSILESRFIHPVENIEVLAAGKYIYGEYEENVIQRINSNLAYFNVPINKIWAKSKTAQLIFDLTPFSDQNIGIFEMSLHYFRSINGEVVQRSFWHGIVVDGSLVEFDKKDMPETAAMSVSHDRTALSLMCGNDENGTSMGWVELNRLGINEDLEENLFSFGVTPSDYINATSGNTPDMVVDTEAPAIKWYGSEDADKAVLRTTMYEATSGTYRLRANFTSLAETTTKPRFLLRCYDASGNIISSTITGWKYSTYYNCYYADTDDVAFQLPVDTAQFNIGFVFIASPSATVSISKIKLTLEEVVAS